MARRFIRYSAALIVFVYAFAKLNGSQFTILDSELDKPMGQVSGFWLTWYYFGYSRFYGAAIAVIELAGAFLLTFQRTTLLGACILAPMLANIIMIDIFYGVDPGAAIIAILLLAAMASFIAPHTGELLALFYPTAGAAHSIGAVSAKWAVRLAMLGLAFGFTYWEANFNNRLPTPIDGVWDLVQVEPRTPAGQLPRTIFFEFNRAYMTVFKAGDGVYTTHHFEVDRGTHQIRIWEAWLLKGRQIFDGRYMLSDRDLTLNGSWENLGEVGLQLHRRTR